MLLKIIILSITLLAALNSNSADNGFTVGYDLPNDEEIFSTEEKGRGSPDYVTNFFKTYTGNNNHVINKVVCKDTSDRSIALAAIVGGGPDHSFVTIAYTIPRHSSMKFNITMYGKPPVFRKIPWFFKISAIYILDYFLKLTEFI